MEERKEHPAAGCVEGGIVAQSGIIGLRHVLPAESDGGIEFDGGEVIVAVIKEDQRMVIGYFLAPQG
jgi:hypothetical protein